MKDLLEVSPTLWVTLGAAALLLLLLVVSFRSRSYVFCQYLKAMTGVSLRPREVRKAFDSGGQEGVRELFLDLIIKEDLKRGPVAIPEPVPSARSEPA
ncbi:MAG: hypothetical protein ABR576_00625 [Thermoanaerobaculia bacterium]